MKRLTGILCAVALLFTGTWVSAEGSTAPTNILIAYYTWADNTIVADADASIASALEHYANMGDDASGTDATSSASLLAPGNTAVMAGHIYDLVGGDLFSIQVSEPYPSNYDETLDRAADELDADARPTLKTHVENMAQYDVIFLGMPNWWYSCPRAILSFIEEYDLSGKTIIPFVAHGTGGISGSVRDMSAALPADCTVLEPVGVYRPDIATCQPVIEEWLCGLDLPFSMGQTNKTAEALRIRLTIGDNVLYATLEDNSAARSLYAMLPLTLSFEDYNGVEKIAYPAEALDTSDAPGSCDPAIGTLALYAPWGNLSIFYQDFRFSEGLVPLGMIDGDMKIFSAQQEAFDVTLEP
ncbi:MAG: cyclophilin-like fold protein [Eubacteriales bacterium]|nr:cyclophilin-like fold protein [Eubacteriales bacterium]